MSEENKINSVTSSVDTGTSIKFIGESDSTGNNLRIEDGKLSGTIVGSVIKDYTGRVDDVTLELANVPIDGVGGAPRIELVKLIDNLSGSFNKLSGVSGAETYTCRFGTGGSISNLDKLTSGRRIIGYRVVFKNDDYGYTGHSICTEMLASPNQNVTSITSGSPEFRELSVDMQKYVTAYSLNCLFNWNYENTAPSKATVYAYVIGEPQA